MSVQSGLGAGDCASVATGAASNASPIMVRNGLAAKAMLIRDASNLPTMDIAVSFWWVDIPPRSKVDFSALAQMGYFDLLLFPLSLFQRVSHPDSQPPRKKIWMTNSLKERSEEHTSELQSRLHLVCRLLLEKKKINKYI